ncbi:MAG: CAP domain-containing protein [Actinomycetaceae bacterium]|nr:CAP domain-containing protein [Actinomycetaceae bacterium]
MPRPVKYTRRAALAIATGIVIGMNSAPIINHSANAAGLDATQGWATNSTTPTSTTVVNISKTAAVTIKKDTLAKSPLLTSSYSDALKNNPHTRKLREILETGIQENFTTSIGTFSVPLAGHTAPTGMALIGVRGTFVTEAAGQNLNTAITHINEIRKDAYDSGLVDRYVPIKRSPALERTAQIRAVEATVYPSHTRPNGHSSSTLKQEGFAKDGSENLAWGGHTLHAAIDQWAKEKQNYINAKNGKNTGETGHYATMINPNNQYVGLGMFTYSSDYGSTAAGIFSSSNPSGPSTLLSGSVIQGIYVPNSTVPSSVEFTLQSSSIGSKATFPASTKVLNARALIEAEINQ